MKKSREIDDKIIYALNTSIPTESFKGQASPTETCKKLHEELSQVHQERADAITKCISITADRLKALRANTDDIELFNNFKLEQRKLRSLQSELNVEDIVKERAFKTFHERCRNYFQDNIAQ